MGARHPADAFSQQVASKGRNTPALERITRGSDQIARQVQFLSWLSGIHDAHPTQ